MNLSPLSSACDVIMGQAPSGDTYNTEGIGLPLVAGASDFGKKSPSPSRYTSNPTKVSEPGDIILCVRATIGDLNWSDRQYCLGRGVAGLRPRKETADSRYLWHAVEAAGDRLSSLGRGATFKQITRSDIANFEILLPKELEEQRRIAAILDKADAIRRKRKKFLVYADGLLKSVFLESFGDPQSNPKRLTQLPLSKRARFISGATPRKSNPKFWDGKFPWISPKDMKTDTIFDSQNHVSKLALEQRNLKKIPANTPLIVVRGMILSHTIPLAMTACEVTINQDMKAIAFKDDIDPVFGFWCLKVQRNRILARVSTAAHGTKRLDMDSLGALPILVPTKDAQQDFVSVARKFTTLRADIAMATDLASSAFASLSQRAFRGEL